MASGSYAISGLNLEPVKREFKVKANRKTARAGDVIKFTITATGVSDRTVRPYYINGVAPEDLANGKTNGLFYLREGKAEVYVQISEEYDRDKDQELVFNVVDKTSTLFRIKRPPQAKVIIKGDGEPNDEQRRQKQLKGNKQKQLKGKNSKSLPASKGGLAKSDPIYPVNVREVAPKALKAGYKALPGITGQKALPGSAKALPAASGAPKALPPAGMKALPSAGAKQLVPASQQVIDVMPISKSVTQIGPAGGSLARSGGSALAKGGAAAGGGALAKGGSAAMKGIPKVGAASLLTAGLEFGSRMDSGQNVVQAGVGTAASTAGGIVGASKGAAVGAALGSVVPGLGTAIGGLLGAVIGGVGGSMLAGGVADAATGANRQEFAEGGHILPKMTDMPFNMPGLSGSFNEPGNPEMMSITPLDDPGAALQSISGIASMVPGLQGIGAVGNMMGGMGNLFGGKPKEYEGLAKAIGEDLEDRGIGDPFGLKGSNKSFGNMTRDMFATAMGESLKKIFGGLFGGGNNGGNTGGTTPGSTSPVSGQASGDMKKGAEMIKSAGVPTRGAAYLAGNIQQESSWNGQRDWGQVLGDGTSRNGGLVSWASWANDPARLGKIEGYLGKNIKEASDGEQINAMLWEMKKDYPGAYKVFMDPNATDAQLKQASKDYWGYGEEGQRYDYAQQALQHLQQSPVQMGQQQMMQASDFKEYDLEYNEANSVVRMADNSLYRTNDRGAITDQQVTLGEANQIMQAKRQQQDTYQTAQIRPGFQQMSYNPAQAQSPMIPPTAQQEVLATPGTFVQGNTGNSRGDHFHIGPELELWGKPEGKTEARRAAFKVAKGLIAKKEHFTFTNAQISIDPNNPPDDQTLMQYVEREQAAHAARSGGGSFGGLDIAGRTGLRMPLGVSDVRDRGDGFGISGTIAGTRAFVGHGMAGSSSTPGSMAAQPGSTSSGFMQTNAQPAKPQGNPEDFFAFAMGAQGLNYQAPPGATATAENLMQTSAQTTMASNKPAVTVVNSPVNNTSLAQSGGGGQSAPVSSAGGSMSDAGLLAYMAQQQLMTIGA